MALGDMELELHDKDKPVTVQNFIRYIQDGLYADMIMHRVGTNFGIQGAGSFRAVQVQMPIPATA